MGTVIWPTPVSRSHLNVAALPCPRTAASMSETRPRTTLALTLGAAKAKIPRAFLWAATFYKGSVLWAPVWQVVNTGVFNGFVGEIRIRGPY